MSRTLHQKAIVTLSLSLFLCLSLGCGRREKGSPPYDSAPSNASPAVHDHQPSTLPGTKKGVPLGIRIDSKERSFIGDSVDLTVIATSQTDLDEARVSIELPDQLRLLFGSREWTGALARGESVTLPMTVEVMEAGDYSILAWIKNDVLGKRAHRNFHAREDQVVISSDPFEILRYQHARTEEQRASTLRLPPGDAEVNTDPDAFPERDTDNARAFRRAISSPPSEEEEGSPERAGGRNITFQGRIVYEDSAGTQHPVRLARVQIVQHPGGVVDCSSGHGAGAGTVLATTNTSVTGNYFTVVNVPDDPDDSDPDLKIRVISQITPPGNGSGAIIAHVEHITAGDLYFCESPLQADVAGTSLTVNFSVGKPTVGSTTDSTASRVFSVLDAMLQNAAAAFYLRGNQLLAEIPVKFPVGGSVSFYSSSNVEISILRADALDWDVLGHEYFHYVTDKGTNRSIDNNPGGSHNGCSAIGQNGRNKDQGMRLAWSEGMATFFGVALQLDNGVPLAYPCAPACIPNGHDSSYQDTEDASINQNMETMVGGCSEGYGSEDSVGAILWDLMDSASDEDPADDTIKDVIGIGLPTIWTLITRGDNDTLAKFYTSVASRPGLTLRHMAFFGQILTLNKVAAKLGSPDDEDIVSPVTPPTFSWTPQGDPAVAFRNNKFTLVITKDNFATQQTWDAGTSTSFTVPQVEWATLFQTGVDENTVLRWMVVARNTAAPATPSGTLLTGNWASHVHRFTPKAFEIKLTWPTVGADVDLHLRPPAGSGFSGWQFGGDCAYYNRTPDFGIPGDPSDNPTLDRDCITSCVEENITLDKITEAGTYKVLVHYYNDHNLGDTTATIVILRFGRVVRTASQSLSNPDQDPDSGSLWTAFEFMIE